MIVYNSFQNIGEETAVALGYFDGVHLGHRAVISAAVEHARANGLKSAVFTFSLQNTSRGGDILSEGERLARIETLGVDYCICPPAEVFYGKDPQWFVGEVILGAFNARAVFCGEDFTFGKGKAGTAQVLSALCAQKGCEVTLVESVCEGGEKVSSTRIRELLVAGEMPRAAALLGAPYTIDFPVQHGKKLGRTIGVPTINQLYPPAILPPRQGVYASSVEIGGEIYPAATGFGTRPTVEENAAVPSAETYILGFEGDLYGENVRTTLHKFLWPTKKYDNVQQLAQMIHRAAEASKQLLQGEENA